MLLQLQCSVDVCDKIWNKTIFIFLNVYDTRPQTDDRHRKEESMKKRGIKVLKISHFVDYSKLLKLATHIIFLLKNVKFEQLTQKCQ